MSRTLQDRAFIAMQYAIPQHLVSRVVYWFTRRRAAWLKNALIDAFMDGFKPDMQDAVEPNPRAYATFNAFFTRALRDGTRPLDADPRSIACPVDGTVSECGAIDSDRLLQAKGHHFTLAQLLASDDARSFEGGTFATIYLAPYNYHRIHMPLEGTLTACRFVPGRLFSVNATTAANVPRVFARNERIVCEFANPVSRYALVLVGALNVGSMETVWHGEVTPRRPRRVTLLPVPPRGATLSKGDEMGRFNMGSTVILVWPKGAVRLEETFRAGRVVRMGERIGTLGGAGS